MMEDLLDTAPCGYFSFFDDGSVNVVNNTVCRLLGYEKNELEGKNVETIFTIPTRIFCQTHFFPLVKMQGHAEEIFLSLLTRTREYLPILLNAKRVANDIPYTACAFIVVPNRKKFEDELVAARNTAEKALAENSELITARAELQQHMEKLDLQMQTATKQNDELKQFNHVVTHSLKEPIRKILVFSEKMQLEGLSEPLTNSVARLAAATQQLKMIVSGLQQYVWLISAATKFAPVDLNTLIKRITTMLREEHGDVFILSKDELPVLEADREQLELLIYHIVANAIQFKKRDRAHIQISGTVIKRNTFRAVADKYKYEDFLRIEFRDDGIGFDLTYKDDIFDLFKKLNYTKGQGLGLALCKKVVENHSGFIEAYSKLNEFTAITALLPLSQTTEPNVTD